MAMCWMMSCVAWLEIIVQYKILLRYSQIEWNWIYISYKCESEQVCQTNAKNLRGSVYFSLNNSVLGNLRKKCFYFLN